MAAAFTLWFNPTCSKCREALALLRAHDVEPAIRNYLETPPTAPELEALVRATGEPAIALVRLGDPLAAELGLDAHSSETAVLAALGAHAALLQRPIVTTGQRAIIARPPEKLLELFENIRGRT